jgi:two-component sensor histidine kinase
MNRSLQRLLEEKERLLQEKEWLLREVHHRVRNNLQIIISLLKMQAAQLKDEPALNAFGGISMRIYTISLIHQQLYQNQDDMTRVDMPAYVRELVGFLEESRGAGRRIDFRLEIAPVRLAVGQSVPVGLILSEAISNAMKYAFPGAHAGPCITISLVEEGRSIRLSVSDNGVGLPGDYDFGSSASMGLPLMGTLTTQLEGAMTVAGGPGGAGGQPGVTIVIVFRRADDSGFLS